MKVINFFGGPNARKSTLAAATYVALKEEGKTVDLVREYATYLILAGRQQQLKEDQLSVLAKQHHLQCILRGRVNYAVTDSPLPLNVVYSEAVPPQFEDLVFGYYNQFDNVNFFLDVDWNTYIEDNRVHKKDEAMRKHDELLELLVKRHVPFHVLPLGSTTERVKAVMQLVTGK